MINEILALMQVRFPKAYERLSGMFQDETASEKKFRMANRFVRCNFGEHDLLTADMVKGHLNLEEVRCPLRGLCKEEGVICKPKDTLKLTKTQQEVLNRYATGKSTEDIAKELGKSRNTIKNILGSICRKFGVPGFHGLLGYIIEHNIVI